MVQYTLAPGQPVVGSPEYTVQDGGVFDANQLVLCVDPAGNSVSFLAVFCAIGTFDIP
jgi:hypothetical protein